MRTDPLDDEPTEEERYELHEGPAYRFDTRRREFVQSLGAGVVLAISPGVSWTQDSSSRSGTQNSRRETISERFHIAQDGIVTVMTSKVEVGQGSRTQMTQAVAEELRLPLDQIRVIMADTELCPDDGGTAGSRTTPSAVPRVRTAAAAARKLLVGLAAKRLNVDRSILTFEDGRFFARGSTKQLTLANLVEDDQVLAELDRLPQEGVSVTRVEQWKLLGTPVRKVNGQEVVTGALRYPSDVVRPDMLYGSVLRPPSFGATLRSIDLAPARAMEGVTPIHDGNFVACAAGTSWRAAQAVEAVTATAEWDAPVQPSGEELFEYLKSHANNQGRGRSRPRTNNWGDRIAAFGTADKRIETSYTVAYIQHAPMEPRAAVAEWNNGKLTVWTGTQQPSRVQGELAEVFRLPENRVRVIVPDTGGGFGGKHTGEVAAEAARLAKAAGRPVSVRWTREEEFTWAYFRPAGLIEVQAGLDNSGRLLVWDFSNYNSGGSAIDTPYEVPHGRTRFLPSESPLRQGSYRALASTANVFARESAMDELADLTDTDPLEFRLDHLPAGRLNDVLQAAADRFDWRTRRKERIANRGVGLACGTEKGSYVAACAEVEVIDGSIKVLSICQAFECGAIQNPHNLRVQVEGCMIMGLGGALFEEIHFKDGKITNASFSEYRTPRMDDVPELDIVLLDRRDLPSVGAGETPIVAVAPAVANAVANATGDRIRSMPLQSGGYDDK
jgi:isoquinoline 1-oxidoreductase